MSSDTHKQHGNGSFGGPIFNVMDNLGIPDFDVAEADAPLSLLAFNFFALCSIVDS